MINTASFVAVMGAATSQISYTASKGGVLALSRELGVEFGKKGVRVNALCPGPVNTPAACRSFREGSGEGGAPARPPADGPLRGGAGDRPGRPLPGLDDSSYVTASTFLVDGGLSGAYVTPE